MSEKTRVSVLETIQIATRARQTLCELPYNIEAPNWLSDGRLLYNSKGRMVFFDPKTGAHTPMDTGFATSCNNDHVVSWDGGTLALSHSDPGLPSRVYTVPLSGGAPTLVTPAGPSYLHGWSPDDQTLAYCACRNGEYDVYTCPFSGGPETRLTFSEGLNDGPEYAPDGRIWFCSVRTGLMHLWRMEADGSQQTQITDDGFNDWFPHPSPDGRLVAFLSYFAGDVRPGDHPPDKRVLLRLLDAQTGKIETLSELFGGQGTMNVPSWSPDGQTLAYVRYRWEESA